MIFQHKKIPLIEKHFNSVKSNILIVGGGRWAIVTIKELLNNFTNLKKILILTRNKNVLQEFSKKFQKKISVRRKLSKKILDKINHAVVVNKNCDHFLSSKKLLNKKINLLVEKPLVSKFSEFETLKKISKKNKKFIHVSVPFFFSYYIFYIKKFINFPFNELVFDWHDPYNDKRYGKIKKYDKSVKYLEDTIYHIYGILNSLFGTKKISLIYSKNKQHDGLALFYYGKNKIRLICSRNKIKKRVRMLRFISNQNNLSLNYANDDNIYFIKNKIKRKISNNFSQKTLKYQLYNFLKNKKYVKKYSLNDIRNFDNLFYLIKAIKKI
jgi:hypothetical protein